MILYPAIDIMNSRCVRLLYGETERVSVYGEPIEFALKFKQAGAKILHIVDLDGAFTGERKNSELLRSIRAAVDIPIQLGGGIRTEQNADYYLEEIGVDRIILGTITVTDPGLTDRLCSRYGNRIVGGIDCRNGYIAVKGWTETSNITAAEHTRTLIAKGIDTIVFTDISRDGALTGVNAEGCSELQANGINVIASGGVSSLADIDQLAKRGIYGAIIGRALYENKFTLEEAIKVCNQ